MDTGKIVDGQFKLLKLIGRGYTSKVYLTEHTKSNKIVALKMYKKKEHTPNEFKIEVESMQKIKHPNVLQIHAANNKGILVREGKKDKQCVYIVIEIAENAELFDFISEPEKGFPEKIARYYFLQFLNGLKAIHDAGFVHRDLKTENVFLDKNFNLKLGDFGFSKAIESNGKLSTVLGTVGYQSPELLETKSYNGVKNDIFAMGVILFIIVNGYPPFREAKLKDPWYRNIYQGQYNKFWEMHGNKVTVTNPAFLDLIIGMLVPEDKRYSLDQILKHEWTNGELPNETEFYTDLGTRKLIVDKNRKKNDDPSLNVKEAESKVTVSKQYRADDNIPEVVDLFENLDLSDFRQGKSGEANNIFTLRLDGDLASSFKFACNLLKKKYNAQLEVLGKTFEVMANVTFTHVDENVDEEFTETLNFTVEIHSDENGKTLAVFNVGHDTNQFTFKKFFSTISKFEEEN